MEIKSGFYLRGFRRVDMGESGAVFVHYEDEPEKLRAPEIKETPQCYGGANTANYTISIPKLRAQKITACAIVTRSSKNCYQATVYDARRIERFNSDTLDGLRRLVADFFKEVAA